MKLGYFLKTHVLTANVESVNKNLQDFERNNFILSKTLSFRCV